MHASLICQRCGSDAQGMLSLALPLVLGLLLVAGLWSAGSAAPADVALRALCGTDTQVPISGWLLYDAPHDRD